MTPGSQLEQLGIIWETGKKTKRRTCPWRQSGSILARLSLHVYVASSWRVQAELGLRVELRDGDTNSEMTHRTRSHQNAFQHTSCHLLSLRVCSCSSPCLGHFQANFYSSLKMYLCFYFLEDASGSLPHSQIPVFTFILVFN